MLKVGIVGFGFMGLTHYKCWKALDDVEIVAVCETNPNIIEDSKKTSGNIGQVDNAIDFANIKLYTDLGQMLKDAELDAVSITLPTPLHADFSIQALSAGVNVMCEKPMALNVKDCDRMIEQAQKSGKILQIGHCVRFWPEYAKAKEIVDSGKYGNIIAASFRRLGSIPTWSMDNWLIDEKRSGGVALDLHIHDTDFVQYLFGMPRAVRSLEAKGPQGGTIHIATQYLYDDDKVVTAEGGWAMMPSFGFEMSFNIMMTEATIVYDLTREPAFKVCPVEGEAFTPEVQQGDGWSLEIAHFAKTIRGEKLEPVTTLEQSRNSVEIVQAEIQSAMDKKDILLKKM